MYSVDLCTITLLGNLVAKPEIRYQSNPIVAIAELTLATHSRWYDKSSQKFKEWTSFHTVKVIGAAVEQALINAEKGDVLLVEGYLLNSKRSNREIIHATFAQHYAKGYAQSINQAYCSGSICSPIQLVTTQNNKTLAEFQVLIQHQVHSPSNQKVHKFSITRTVHAWEKSALLLQEKATIDDRVVISGKLNYLNNTDKNQLIDANQIDLLKSSP